MKFNPCTGQCTQEDSHCEGCGRSHVEIAEMRKLVTSAVEFANKMDYENTEEFAQAFGHSIKYMAEFSRQ